MSEKLIAFLTKIINEITAFIKAQPIEQEPPRPDKAPPPIAPEIEAGIQPPTFVVVKGVKYKTHGNYKTKAGRAKGLVVHYTVSGRSAIAAKNVVSFLAKEGLGCMVMDESGVIYIPEGFNYLTDVAYHAGQSEWKGVSGISAYCMGMEICNWGTDAKVHGAQDVIVQENKNANIKPGVYQKYTEAQEKALVNFCLYMNKNNPEFDLEWVVGHDEIAPKRKSDPGASLSMTMPQFRKSLKASIDTKLGGLV